MHTHLLLVRLDTLRRYLPTAVRRLSHVRPLSVRGHIVDPYITVERYITSSTRRSLPWVEEVQYLGVHFVKSRSLKCSLDEAKCGFFRATNAIFGKVGTVSSKEVVLELVKCKCLPILLYGLECCPLNMSDVKSLDFFTNNS